ncbi:MAG TPA: polymer-forming cytoskeletal protein [Gemmatimonadales bacterium]|jgi:cytoskeletal protein CcmA (bactofilin family)
MPIWNEKQPAKGEPAAANPEPARSEPPRMPAPSVEAPMRRGDVAPKESVIAADLTVEGKIEGSGHVRLAGKFKGDVNVQGHLTIESGAKLTGGVRAQTVIVGGELDGNIDAAARVELLETGVLIGDLKAGSLTVAAGSRMRGQVEFGWDEKKVPGALRLEGTSGS